LSLLWRQPIKGVWITLLSVLLTWITYLFMIEYAKCTLDAFMAWICIAFSVMWITGFSLQRWPASKIKNPLLSSISAIIFQSCMAVIVGFVMFGIVFNYWGLPLTVVFSYEFFRSIVSIATPWAVTAIFFWSLQYFYAGNALAKYAGIANKQPIEGIMTWLVQLGLATLVVGGGYFLGLSLYVPWIWFPIVCIQLVQFDGWPISKVSEGARTIYNLAITVFLSGVYWYLLDLCGIPFTSLPGQLHAIILTVWAVGWPWVFNNWPLRGIRTQPLKGIVQFIFVIVCTEVSYWINVHLLSVNLYLSVILWFTWIYWAIILCWHCTCFTRGYEKSPL